MRLLLGAGWAPVGSRFRASKGNSHVVQRQLGRARLSITLDVYSWLYPRDLTAAAANLNKVYEDLQRENDGDGVVVQMAR